MSSTIVKGKPLFLLPFPLKHGMCLYQQCSSKDVFRRQKPEHVFLQLVQTLKRCKLQANQNIYTGYEPRYKISSQKVSQTVEPDKQLIL